MDHGPCAGPAHDKEKGEGLMRSGSAIRIGMTSRRPETSYQEEALSDKGSRDGPTADKLGGAGLNRDANAVTMVPHQGNASQ